MLLLQQLYHTTQNALMHKDNNILRFFSVQTYSLMKKNFAKTMNANYRMA